MADRFNLTKIEEKIQKLWEANDILEKSLAFRRGRKKFVFYEGPPTANGLPHIGHFLIRAFKDLFVRYKTMAGFFVVRKAGWDTHGLPVEIEVEKELGLKNKKEVKKYGIARFNKKAKESVWRYKAEWEKFSKRIGFWLDFKNPYITYANDYIETLWHVISRFDKKKFLYKGHKVLPWCPRCGTALSSHEVAQGYESITEASVYVKFRVKSEKFKSLKFKDTYILSWTTTVWTLPGNVALAVGDDIDYVVVSKNGENYILAKDLAEKVMEKPYELVREVKGKDLIGLEYEPLFRVQSLESDKSYKIYPADFVSTEDGTGVVHTAVMYGEEDYQLGEKIGLPKHHTVDEEGRFTDDVPEPRSRASGSLRGKFAGRFVKDAEKDIIAYLKEKNLLFKVEPYAHEYPFCWRCKTPLLYYAADSWFVKTTAVRKQLIANNKKINWVPEYIKEGRFGQWLSEIKDWAFSRDRFWGTPLPVWQCGKCRIVSVIASLKELEKSRYRKPNRYFVLRHTESGKNNFKGREINSTKLESDKYDLTEKGIEEAKRAAGKLENKKIDLVFTSPFLRTKRTAQIVADELGLEIKIDGRLKELDHGSVCEGRDYYACIPKEEYPHKDFNAKFGLDGESRNEVRKRIFSFVKELEERYEGENILIVSHGDPLWLMEGISENLSEEELFLEKEKQLLGVKNGKLKMLKLGESKILIFANYPRDEFGNLDLHRPYIDEVFLKCSGCGGKMQRVPEVADVWFDSGAMPFAQSHWPFEKEKPDFPADFITEGVDQTRGWFYTLLAVSTLLGFGPPYKNVISLGHVLDKDGKKMSKSLGNVVTPDYVIEKFGVDAVRWWFYKVNPAGEPKIFREEELKETSKGFIRAITNSLRFWQLYSDSIKYQTSNIKIIIQKSKLSLLDVWLLSRWNNLVVSVADSLDKYDATTASREIEKFVIEDLSNWWIRRSREKFQLEAAAPQKDLLRFVLFELTKLIAPFTPFLAEYLHKELHQGAKSENITVHFLDWPKADKKLIDKKLEEEMESVREIVSLGLAARKENNIKVRQPLASLKVSGPIFKISERLQDLIKEEVNVKSVEFKSLKSKEAGKEKLSVVLDTEISPALRAGGWVREFVRMVQDARRDAGYDFNQKINAFWFSEDDSMTEAIKREGVFIKQKTVLKEFNQIRHNPEFVYDVEKEQELEPGRKIWLGLKK